MELSPIELYIILHIKKAQVDYAKMIMKMTELNLEEIQRAIDHLLKLGFLERDSGSAIKRTRARFKLATEVHKHHTYYKLSREGTLFVRGIDRNYLENYFNSLFGAHGFIFINYLKESKNFEDACKNLRFNCKYLFKALYNYHFITESGNKTRFFNRFIAFAEL